MFGVFLKLFLGLLTVGGLGVGVYFLHKYSVNKKTENKEEPEKVIEDTTSDVDPASEVADTKGDTQNLPPSTISSNMFIMNKKIFNDLKNSYIVKYDFFN